METKTTLATKVAPSSLPSDAGDVVSFVSTTTVVDAVTNTIKPATATGPAPPVTPADSVKADVTTLAPTPVKLTVAPTTIPNAVTQATTKHTAQPVTTPSPAPAKPDKKTAPPPTTVPTAVTLPSATTIRPNVVTPAVTAGNTEALVVSRDVVTATRSLGTVAPTGGTSKTEAPASSHVGTTQPPKVLTVEPTSQKSSANTLANTLAASQGTSDSIIQKTTVAASQGHTTPASSKLAVSTLVPSVPSTTPTPTTIVAGTSATKVMNTKAEATPAKPATAATTTTNTTPLRFSPTSGISKEMMATTTKTKTVLSKKFVFSLNNGQENEEDKKLVAVCKRVLNSAHLKDGSCSLTYQHHNDKLHFEDVEIRGKVETSLAEEYYEELNKKPTDNKTLIAILASCGALLIMIVILAVCASHHRKPYSENQQHLTEELPTVENGYHDNPTLDVMEAQSEMQEKKSALNGEFIDGWIVPMENMKGDVPDEEDTHL